MNTTLPADKYGYELALIAAGATVHDFERFGSYQGDWLARVTLPDGRTGWIKDYYGSCSGCDAFEAEFSWSRAETPDALAEFGRKYFDQLLSQEEAEADCAKHAAYSLEDGQMLAFVVSKRAGGER
jgi:hypothetical protein